MVKKPSAKSLIKNIKKFEPKTPIANEMFIPNHSGVSDHPEFNTFLDTNFLKIDGSNANQTINIGSEDLRTSGFMQCGEFRIDDFTLNNNEILGKSGTIVMGGTGGNFSKVQRGILTTQ